MLVFFSFCIVFSVQKNGITKIPGAYSYKIEVTSTTDLNPIYFYKAKFYDKDKQFICERDISNIHNETKDANELKQYLNSFLDINKKVTFKDI